MRRRLFAALLAACGTRTGVVGPEGDRIPAAPTVELALGWSHSCLLRRGEVHCWGDGSSDLFGIDLLLTCTSLPCRGVVPQIEGVVQITASVQNGCALIRDGSIRCWGLNEYGQLGQPTGELAPPRAVAGLDGVFVAVSTATDFTCALGVNGIVRCIGGVPGVAHAPPGTGAAIAIDGPPAIRSIAVSNQAPWGGSGHACALDADGAAWCWGLGATGRLGDGTDENRDRPTRVLSTIAFTQVAVGGEHTCALDVARDAWCWGVNGNGRLGDGTTQSRSIPTRVIGLSGVKRLAAGGYHTCALLHDATVECWGANGAGQIGDGTVGGAPTFGSLIPRPVLGPANIVDLAAGWKHNCAATADGDVWCWGLNDFGQLGVAPGPTMCPNSANVSESCSPTPVRTRP